MITELDRDEREFAADSDVNFNLDDGDLDMEGEITDEDFREGEIVLDVVDGTDAYEDADGTATFSGAHGRRGGKGHHQMAAASADPTSMDTAMMSAVLPMHGGGHGDGDKDGRGDKKDGSGDKKDGDGDKKDGRGDKKDGRGHRGGDRHFKADVDLD